MPKYLGDFLQWMKDRNKEYHKEAMAKIMPALCESCELAPPHRYYNAIGVWICTGCDLHPGFQYSEERVKSHRQHMLDNALVNRAKRKKV